MITSKLSTISRLILITFLFPLTIQSQNAEGNQNKPQNDESAVKATVEDFLASLGNNDMEKVKTLFLPNANIASITMANGEPKLFTISADQYISQRKEKENKKFEEPVRRYTINISQGLLAFVRADATVFYDGKASHHTNDFFILMKDNGIWKILSGSYTVEPI